MMSHKSTSNTWKVVCDNLFMTGQPTPLNDPLRNKGLYNEALLRETNG